VYAAAEAAFVEQFLAPSVLQLTSDAVRFAIRHGLAWYWIPAGGASLLLLFASLFGDRPQSEDSQSRLRRSDLFYLLAVAVFLLALRWPVLAVGDLEGDESVAVSAALTRFLDPVYGVTIFTGSAGPLLTYPVAALGLLGIRIDFGASKLVSLLLIVASSGVLYLALRTFSQARTARVALLPLLAFLGLGSAAWTLSYCSELWINLLMISAVCFLLRLDRRIGREAANLSGIGLALGSIPLVKWQGVPMAALVAATAVAVVWNRCRREPAGLRGLAVRLLPLVALGLAPLLVWCAILWSFGGLGFFFETYFVALFTQATSRYSTTLLERLVALPAWGIQPFPKVRMFLYSTALFWVPAAIVLYRLYRPRRFLLELALASLYLVISVYAVLQPGGPFTHYLNLLLQPYAVLVMLVFCHLAQAMRQPVFAMAAYLGLAVLPPAILYFQDDPIPVRFPPMESRSALIDAMLMLNAAGSPMIQWGWAYGCFVSTGTTWGTRTGGSHEILEPFFPNKSIFIADYVENLDSGRAPVFLDTATEGSLFYPRRAKFGHETVSEIGAAVRRNYFLCAELPGSRLYLNRERYQADAEVRAWCERQSDWTPPGWGTGLGLGQVVSSLSCNS
jgi:hypothetical protein